MTTTENPLVAQPETGTTATAGTGIFDDVATTVKDFSGGNWMQGGLDAATDGLDLLGAAMDPLGTLASAGVGWLIEHISFLREGLDKLAGNPQAVTAKAVTWQNIAKQLNETADGYEQSAGTLAQSYQGEGGPAAYQKTAKGYAESIRGAAGHAESASTAMQVAAALVGTERGLIRDLISSFVSALIIKAIAAVATAWCSFGGTVAALIADTVLEGASLAEKISSRITKIVEKLETLAQAAGKSKGIIEAAANGLKKVGKAADKIADKGLDAAVKLDSKAKDLKAAPKISVGEQVEKLKNSIPHLDENIPGGQIAEPNRNILSGEQWEKRLFGEEGAKPPKWSPADTAGVVEEGRRQWNEQGARSKETTEAYEKEHGEGGAE
ncbi:hypothetical protein [Amycolatopsis sp. GM8]|uniref:hypothetical protein n=1 Tax=Amycolatopsis sp. GM8 TaxID=2896530 RepID=UPI001F164E51|nr:hypothetical protein [Amycolatopsis sp. GM8]